MRTTTGSCAQTQSGQIRPVRGRGQIVSAPEWHHVGACLNIVRRPLRVWKSEQVQLGKQRARAVVRSVVGRIPAGSLELDDDNVGLAVSDADANAVEPGADGAIRNGKLGSDGPDPCAPERRERVDCKRRLFSSDRNTARLDGVLETSVRGAAHHERRLAPPGRRCLAKARPERRGAPKNLANEPAHSRRLSLVGRRGGTAITPNSAQRTV